MKLNSSTFCFETVNKESLIFRHVRFYFKNMIQPYYGEQSQALIKIGEAKDRTCEMLFEDDKEVGLIVFKNQLSNEYANLLINNSMEIKTLFVIEPEKNSGRGIASLLLLHIVANALQLEADSLLVTVSTGKPESKKFFLDKEFRIKEVIKNKYVHGYDEYLLCHDKIPELFHKLNNNLKK